MFKKTVMATLLASSILSAESGGSININDKDVEVEATLDSRNLAAFQTSSTLFLADANLLSSDNQKLLGLGLSANNKVEGLIGVEMSFGVKFIWAEVGAKKDNFTSVPLMAKVRYTLPPLMFNIPPVGVEAKGLYSPGSLSFGNAEGYSEFRFSGDIEMIENVKIYAGYRNIHTKYNGLSRDLFNTGFYAGLKATY